MGIKLKCYNDILIGSVFYKRHLTTGLNVSKFRVLCLGTGHAVVVTKPTTYILVINYL